MASIKLGEILVKQGVVRPDQMNKALEEQKRSGGKLGQILVQMGIIKDVQLLKALEQAYQVPGIDLNTFQIQPTAVQLIPRDVCERHTLIPVQKVGTGTLVVAFSDPGNVAVRDDLRFITRCKIQVVVATDGAINASIDKYYSTSVSKLGEVVDESSTNQHEIAMPSSVDVIDFGQADGEEGPIVKFVNAILSDAIKKRVSDIHFEPYEKKFRVRYRLDGAMSEAASQSPASAAAIASRIKIMAKLDIAEKRPPQQGRIKIRLSNNKDIDFRVSILPTI